MDATSQSTDSQGRFLARFELGLQSTNPVEVQVEVVPPLGMGYVLGKAKVEGLAGVYQPPPVADTTFVQIVLPPNTVGSRRPVRVEVGYHRAGNLRAEADRFYLSAPNGVAALNPATGEWLWQRGSLAGLAGPPYALMGEVVVVAGLGSLTALRAVDGETLWSRDDVPNRTLTVSEPDGLYATDGRGVVAYDPETGATRWRKELIGVGNVAIAASSNLVCAEILAYVECWEPSTGEPVWSRPTEFADWLAIAGQRVILGSGTGWTALDGGTGEVAWEAAFDQDPTPVFSEDRGLAFACSHSACFAVRIEDGQIAWRTPFEDEPGVPAVGGESLYVRVGEGAGSSSLYVIDAASGAIRERILPDPFDYGFCGTPAVGSEFVLILGCRSLYTFEMSP